jgi:hypothetical protein
MIDRLAEERERDVGARASNFRHVERMVDHLCTNAAYRTATLPDIRFDGAHVNLNGDLNMCSGGC